MSTISSLGVGSGIDVRSLVDDLVAAERAPTEGRLDRQQAQAESQISAYGQLGSALNTFQGAISSVSDIQAFRSRTASSSNEAALGVSASRFAEPGSFSVDVQQLASSQGLASGNFADRDSAVGTGTLTFRFGTTTVDPDSGMVSFNQSADKPAQEISINSDNNSLRGLRDAINSANMGVRASIINDGSGERLVMNGSDSGTGNGFIIEASEGADPGLSRLAFNPDSATEMQLNSAAQDARFTVDGLQITRPSNSISDVINGVTLDLRQAESGISRVTIDTDTSGVKSSIQGFVEAFNILQKEIATLGKANPEGESGLLVGDSTLRNLGSSLRNLLGNTVNELAQEGIRSLADLGIRTQEDGSLSLDDATLDAALRDNFDLVGAVFAPVGRSDSSNLDYISRSASTRAGNYSVSVTQAASRGSFIGGAASTSFPTTITDGSNTLQLKVDGIASKNPIALTPGEYANGSVLAKELQAQINADPTFKERGIRVEVAFDEATGFTIKSERLGSSSQVELTSASQALRNELGLTPGVGTAGTDVQGTIGGITARGDGDQLIAISGPAEGLRIRVNSNQLGNLGTMTFSEGLMGQLADRVRAFSGPNGILGSRSGSLENQLKGIAEQRERLERRIEQVEARYVAQFSAMDALVAQLRQTGDFLTQQLDALNPPKKR